MNLAARLLELAHAGETVLSDDVYRACVSSIEVDHVATSAIRGFANEMPVWKLRSLRMDAAAEHPLLGRDGEVARFEALLQDVEAGRHGGGWLIRADPGMGKTRLVQELVAQARLRGFATHTSCRARLRHGTRARCDPCVVRKPRRRFHRGERVPSAAWLSTARSRPAW